MHLFSNMSRNLRIINTSGFSLSIFIYGNFNFNNYILFRLFLVCSLFESTLHINGIKVRVFFEKKYRRKHLCHHDKNYCYFCKSNIPVISLILGSRIMIKVSKIWVCKKLDKRRASFSPNTDNFLTFFIVFEWGRILESAMDK